MHEDFVEQVEAAPGDPIAANKATVVETLTYVTTHHLVHIERPCELVDDVLADLHRKPLFVRWLEGDDVGHPWLLINKHRLMREYVGIYNMKRT